MGCVAWSLTVWARAYCNAGYDAGRRFELNFLLPLVVGAEALAVLAALAIGRRLVVRPRQRRSASHRRRCWWSSRRCRWHGGSSRREGRWTAVPATPDSAPRGTSLHSGPTGFPSDQPHPDTSGRALNSHPRTRPP